MLVCFIILHYKKAEETTGCIDSILRMNGSDRIQIVVVDNSPDDDSGQVIKGHYDQYENICIISSEENAGFSRANNIGYRYALTRFHPDYIVAANNDIEFLQTEFIDLVEEIYHHTHFAVLGPDVVHAASGGHQSPIDIRLRTVEEAKATIRKNRIALKLSGILYPLLYLTLSGIYENKGGGLPIDYEKQHEKIVPLGACLIFSKEFLNTCENAFYPETDFFYEEYILAHRCERLGLKIVYDPAIKIRHESGATTKKSYKNIKKRVQFVLSNTMKSCQVYLGALQ